MIYCFQFSVFWRIHDNKCDTQEEENRIKQKGKLVRSQIKQNQWPFFRPFYPRFKKILHLKWYQLPLLLGTPQIRTQQSCSESSLHEGFPVQFQFELFQGSVDSTELSHSVTATQMKGLVSVKIVILCCHLSHAIQGMYTSHLNFELHPHPSGLTRCPFFVHFIFVPALDVITCIICLASFLTVFPVITCVFSHRSPIGNQHGTVSCTLPPCRQACPPLFWQEQTGYCRLQQNITETTKADRKPPSKCQLKKKSTTQTTQKMIKHFSSL